MVYLALSQNGLEEAVRAASPRGDAVWCTSESISEPEFRARKVPNLTRLGYSFQADNRDMLLQTLETIEEHHPGESIWVQMS
jgi:hypothetical protein